MIQLLRDMNAKGDLGITVTCDKDVLKGQFHDITPMKRKLNGNRWYNFYIVFLIVNQTFTYSL